MKAVAAPYVYIWEFSVSPAHTSAFERAYGPSGEWVQLFRRAPGYLRTELHRDRSQPHRFITIDYWESKNAWDAFRARFAPEFDALDAKCATWATSEINLGHFEPVS